MRRTARRRLAVVAGAALLACGVALSATDARAQLSTLTARPTEPVSRDQPVYYTADSASYDRTADVVTLTGHVEIWQNDRILRADKVTFDRNTNVAAATGHVVLLEPDGQVLFSEYAELGSGLKEGVLRNMSAQLAENGHLAANGARRTDASINELSRAIYSTCNVCAQHPDSPPLWDIRARSALQDVPNKRIEYRDAVIDFDGLPVAYFPYLTHPDPSQKRASGLLVPSAGYSKHLGAFAEVPYYWVLDNQSDTTITPIIASDTGPAVLGEYRRRFNSGTLTADGSLGYDQKDIQAHIFATGRFSIDDVWRYGFDLNRATSSVYLRDFNIAHSADLLTSQAYIEGFGQGAYTKLDARAYQGTTSNVIASNLPYVLPRYTYDFVGQPDALGGRFALDAGAFNVLRQTGTNTQRISTRLNWDRPFTGPFGDLWKVTLHADGAAYNAGSLDQQPSYGPRGSHDTAQGMPDAALEVRWPLARDAGSWGTQLIEPIAQVIAAPNGSRYPVSVNANGTRFVDSLVPNEDALDYNFTDASLFSLNRFSGLDRLEGGVRANVALHGSWFLPGGSQIDGLIGQGYRLKKDPAFPVGSGLENRTTDIVAHESFAPNQYVDFTLRERFDRHKLGTINYGEAVVSAGVPQFRVTSGYLYSNTNLYDYYLVAPTGVLPKTPRNEVSAGFSTSYGPWRLHASGRQDVQLNKPVGASVGAGYEDECFIFDVLFDRRYTSLNNDTGATTVLFQVTLKTVGQFGFHAF